MLKKLYIKEKNQELLEDYKKSDRFMLRLIAIHWLLVSTLSAYSYNTYFLGFIGGGVLFFLTYFSFKMYSGTPIFRILTGIILMSFTIISIQQNLGRLEMHFHVFVALSFLSIYKDLKPAIMASIYIILHHLVFTYLQLNSIYLFDMPIIVYNYGCSYDIALLHAFYVVFECIILYIIINNNTKNFNDINRYKKQLEISNEELKVSSDNFKELFNITNESILIFDQDKNVVDFNNSAIKTLGYKKYENELYGKNLFEFIPPNEIQKVKKEVVKDVAKAYELNLIKKDGTIFPAFTAGTNIIRDKKTWRISTFIDLTDIKNKEKSLIKSEKLAAMGDMIGNIAHQWRQPLSVISTSATGMKLQKEHGNLSDKEFFKYCNFINENAQYLSRTIDDFRNFIKGDKEKTPYNLSKTIKSFILLIEGSIKSNNINIISDLDDDIQIVGYPSELIQCFMNIYNNSKDAMAKLNEKDKLIFISTSIINKNIFINIKDSGGGIPKDIISNIFEPYFTTKHKSQGTGLGLNMTYNIITKGMDGNIEAINTKYQYNNIKYSGAQFIIKLPME